MDIIKKKTRYGVMTVEIMDITPDTAREMLGWNKNNRPLKTQHLKGYEREMMLNIWKENGEPIHFDDEGNLVNGQHRLESIAASGITAHNVIVVTVPKSQATCYDIGILRSLRDVAILENKEGDIYNSVKILGAASYMYRKTYNLSPSQISKTDILRHIEKYEDAFRWGLETFGKNNVKGSQRAPVMASVISAYIMGYPKDKLEHFVEVIKEGFSTDETDKTIITLRNYLYNYATEGQRDEVYYKVQNALKAYLDGKILTKLYNKKIEYFKMPEM